MKGGSKRSTTEIIAEIEAIDAKMKSAEMNDAKLSEGKWNHDAIGGQGPVSKYIDGVQSVTFSFDSKRQVWTYDANVSSTNNRVAPGYSSEKDSGVLSDKDAYHFDMGDKRGMTKVAKSILSDGPQLLDKRSTLFEELEELRQKINPERANAISKLEDVRKLESDYQVLSYRYGTDGERGLYHKMKSVQTKLFKAREEFKANIETFDLRRSESLWPYWHIVPNENHPEETTSTP